MGSKSVQAPPPRSYEEEMRSALNAQINIQPWVIDAERRFAPQWQALQEQKFRKQTGTMLGVYGDIIPASQKLAQSQLSAMSPFMGQIGATASSAYKEAMGPQATNLLSRLQIDATRDLGLGRSLSAEETTMGQQAAREAAQARGLQHGNQAVAMEVLNNNTLATQRETMRRGFAQNVYNMSEASNANAYNQYGQPLMAMVGTTMPSALMNAAGNMMQGLGPQFVNPESGYNAALISANRKEQMDAQIANAQNDAAIAGAFLGSMGQIGGAFIGRKPA